MLRPVTLLIDELGPGGTQRQLSILSLELVKQGYSVRIVYYHPNNWYKKYLLDNNIRLQMVTWKNQLDKILRVRQVLKEQKNGVIISFLKGPNILNILAGLPRKNSKIIVSERTTDSLPLSLKTKFCFLLYKIADTVIVNSNSQRNFLNMNVPHLSKKIRLIQNCVDLGKFTPDINNEMIWKDRLIFGVFASYSKHKGFIDLVLSVKKLIGKLEGRIPYFVWYGEYKDPLTGKIFPDFEIGSRLIQEQGLKRFFDLQGPTAEPEKVMARIDCLCLVSQREGFPNSICEAFASGKPVVATRVGDVPYLVTEGRTGFVAEPKSSESIASALLKMLLLDDSKRLEMGKSARHFAEQNLSVERFCKQYIEIINS